MNICSVNLATHKEKKALISLRKQKPGFAPQDVAAIIAQHNTQVSVITIQLSFSLSSLSPSSFLSLIRTRQCCHYHFLSLLSLLFIAIIVIIIYCHCCDYHLLSLSLLLSLPLLFIVIVVVIRRRSRVEPRLTEAI